MHQVILNVLVTKYLDKKFFDYIYPRSETLAFISCNISASYHRTIMPTPGLAVFGRDKLFNLASVVDWRFATAANQFVDWLFANAANQRQVDIDNVR